MGLTEIFSDFYAAIGMPEIHAEAPPKEEEEESEEGGEKEEEGGEEKEEGEGGEEGGEDEGEGGEEEGGEEEEEEEEEEEVEDPKPKLEEECARSAQCLPYKHHFDECAERVTKQHENPDHKGPKEDCVEEFFHLQHCATQCAAPKLFRMLK
ncbi:hypothetical protein JMJ35_003863 [Cladonia borealis]|uniref:Cytochrome b-c1 complex subunit 6, mitochondrial n=1 Tax=Cladonia borealis TaxID=184061 RepID=A0AA39R4Y7_9LECA|nr:hypothetical protein JMJ35_003863 [Cladonia borealis]